MHRPPEIKPHNVAQNPKPATKQAPTQPPAKPKSAPVPANGLPPQVSVKLKARMVFWRQLATCMKGGMTLGASLHHMQGVTRNSELKEAARKAQICVERGGSLAAWMKTRPQAFSRGESALILAGETSGDLDKICDRIATDLENEHKLRRKIFTATFLNKYVVLPQLILVPGITLVLTGGVDALTKHGDGLSIPEQQKLVLREGLHAYMDVLIPRLIFIAVIALIYFVLLRVANATQEGRKIRDALAMRVPLTGPLWRDLAIFRYLTALGYLSNAGIQPAAALELCQGIAGNAVLDEKFARAARLARQNNMPLGESLEKSGVFSDVTLSLIRTGEVSGSTPAMFAQAASYYETDVTQRMISVPKLVGVICFIIAAIATGIVVGLEGKAYILGCFDAVGKFMGVDM